MAVGTTKVVQVTNIAPQATKDQMQILFGYLGKIEDIRLYPTIRDVSCPVQSRICYIKFIDSITVGIAQHMTNTVFIDRALIVIPVGNGEIPDEYYALEMTRNGTIVPGLNVNEPKLPPHVSNVVQGSGDEQIIATLDPKLAENDLPAYPPLPANYDSVKVEETRRTVLVVDRDSSWTIDDMIDFFSPAGEVKYLRECTRKVDGVAQMLIEFSDQPSVVNALKLNGTELKGKLMEIQHATQAIVKPQAKSNEAAQKEIEEAMSRFKEAQNMINASIEPVIGMLTKDKRSRRSRSRSRSRRHRSRSRSASRRSRSRRRRSNSRNRRSRSRERRRRSKSKSRRRSHSRTRRSHSQSSRSRRSRSKSASKRGRHRSKGRESRAKSREKRSKDRSKDHSRRSRERDRKSKDVESEKKEKAARESKELKSDKESSADVSERKRSGSRSPSRRRSRSRDRKDKKRSRSRGRSRRSPSSRSSKRRSRTRSKERKREKKEKKEKRDRSRSRPKVTRNYDEEEKRYVTMDKQKDTESTGEKDSEKSDNMDISNSP